MAAYGPSKPYGETSTTYVIRTMLKDRDGGSDFHNFIVFTREEGDKLLATLDRLMNTGTRFTKIADEETEEILRDQSVLHLDVYVGRIISYTHCTAVALPLPG